MATKKRTDCTVSRRNVLLGGTTLAAASAIGTSRALIRGRNTLTE